MGVHLTGVHLTGVHLTDVHLTGVYLTGVHLTGAYLVLQARISPYTLPENTVAFIWPPLVNQH